MRNRLKEAFILLKNDGAIFVSINHIEIGYLSVLLDEIFGQENKLPIITLRAGTTASYRSINDCPVNVTEYVLAYSKSSNFKPNSVYRESSYSEDYSHFIVNKKNSPDKWELQAITDIIHKKFNCENWREFKEKFGANWKKKRYEEMEIFAIENRDSVVSLNTLQKPSKRIKEEIDKSKSKRNKVFEVKREGSESIYCYNGRTLAFFSSKFREIDGEQVPSEILTNLWSDVSFLGIGPEGGVTLENGKKPEYLIKTILELITKPYDIVLDYHLGSGTTAAVCHKMQRQYIGVEQLNYGDNDSVVRLKNVINGEKSGVSDYEDVKWQGGGSFVYLELKKYNQAFIEQIEVAKDTETLLQIWEQMKAKSFLNYNVDIKKQDEHLEEFKALSLAEQKQHLCELLDKNQLYVNLSSLNDADFACTDEEKKVTKDFYQIKK
jgi:adenine-specific DNA-methyltransferase